MKKQAHSQNNFFGDVHLLAFYSRPHNVGTWVLLLLRRAPHLISSSAFLFSRLLRWQARRARHATPLAAVRPPDRPRYVPTTSRTHQRARDHRAGRQWQPDKACRSPCTRVCRCNCQCSRACSFDSRYDNSALLLVLIALDLFGILGTPTGLLFSLRHNGIIGARR